MPDRAPLEPHVTAYLDRSYGPRDTDLDPAWVQAHRALKALGVTHDEHLAAVAEEHDAAAGA